MVQTFIYPGWTTGKSLLPQKRVWPSWGQQSREQVFTVQVRQPISKILGTRNVFQFSSDFQIFACAHTGMYTHAHTNTCGMEPESSMLHRRGWQLTDGTLLLCLLLLHWNCDLWQAGNCYQISYLGTWDFRPEMISLLIWELKSTWDP